MIFPRLGPSGASWCAEGLDGQTHTVVVDGRLVARQAIQPAWADEDRLVFSDTHTAHVWLVGRDGTVLEGWATPAPVNRLQAQGGHWLGWMPTYLGTGGYVLDGVAVAATQEPVLGPDGTLWTPPATCIEGRATRGGRTAIDHARRPPAIHPDDWAPWPCVTHWAVPVAVPTFDGPWVLRLDDERLVLHPRGIPYGWVVASGVTRWPDAVWHDAAQAVRVVWSTAAGVIESRHLELDAPRVDLREAGPSLPPSPPQPPAPPESPTMPDYRTFRWDRCTIHRDAADIGSWPMTSRPTRVAATDGEVTFEHTRAGQWPRVPYADIWVEGAIWTVAPDGDGWRAATWDRLRPGQTAKGMEADQYQLPYALDLLGWVPRAGEIVGYLVSTPARMDERGPVNERSPIAWVRFGDEGGVPVALEGDVSVPDPPGPPTPGPNPGPLEARVAALEQWARGLAFRG